MSSSKGKGNPLRIFDNVRRFARTDRAVPRAQGQYGRVGSAWITDAGARTRAGRCCRPQDGDDGEPGGVGQLADARQSLGAAVLVDGERAEPRAPEGLFEGEEAVLHVIETIVAPLGLRVDESSPWVAIGWQPGADQLS